MNTSAILAELKQIQANDPDGLLKPSEVVTFAKNPDTELHKHFEWDDSEAAGRYRIEQARGLIQRVWVTVLPNESVTHRAFVSLMPDRASAGGGYRDIEGVMADPVKTKSYLETALSEFRALQRKYQSVEALAPVYSALDRVAAKARHQVSKPKPATASV